MKGNEQNVEQEVKTNPVQHSEESARQKGAPIQSSAEEAAADRRQDDILTTIKAYRDRLRVSLIHAVEVGMPYEDLAGRLRAAAEIAQGLDPSMRDEQ